MTEVPPPPQGPVFVPPGGQPPPGYVAYYPAHAVPPAAPKKPNGTATASLIVSGGALGLLVFTFGVVAPITLIASIIGTVLGHKAKAATDRDPEVGQRDEAIAGFWMGIAGIILAVLAIILVVAFIVWIGMTDEGFDFNDFDERQEPSEFPHELQY
ncbi:MAG: DUF4190 domain-containing protein [Solirubrobacterales bacterium]